MKNVICRGGPYNTKQSKRSMVNEDLHGSPAKVTGSDKVRPADQGNPGKPWPLQLAT